MHLIIYLSDLAGLHIMHNQVVEIYNRYKLGGHLSIGGTVDLRENYRSSSV